MADRAIFLDRDNTIIEDKEGYLGDPAKVKLLPGAAAAIATLRRLNYRIIVASNQSGVARGMFSEEDVEAVNQEMVRQLREQAGAHVDASYYCPYHPEAVVPEYRLDHEWRKPKCGMLKQAIEDFGLDAAQCWMIGDSARDIACGAAAGCRTILIKDPDHADTEPDNGGGADLQVSPNFIVKSLADAARIVAREGRNPHPELASAPRVAAVVPQPEAAPAQAPAAIDEAALADKVAERVAKAVSRVAPQPESTKPVLEEMLRQMRQQNRLQEVPEFSLGRMIGILAQILAIGCLIAGIWLAVGVVAPNVTGNAWYVQIHTLLRAGLFMLAALVLQGIVIAGLLMGRQK